MKSEFSLRPRSDRLDPNRLGVRTAREWSRRRVLSWVASAEVWSSLRWRSSREHGRPGELRERAEGRHVEHRGHERRYAALNRRPVAPGLSDE